MSADDLRRKADHFRTLACGESDPVLCADLRLLAGEYEAAAVQLESGATAKWGATVTLPNC